MQTSRKRRQAQILQELQGDGPTFNYEQKEELVVHKLVHSILIEAAKSKSLLPSSLVGKICQNSGLECNDQVFFKLLAQMGCYAMAETVADIRKSQKSAKRRAQILNLKEVQQAMEDREVYLMATKKISTLYVAETESSDSFIET